MPNIDQVLALVRALLIVIGTVVTARGFSAESWSAISGVVVMIIPLVWSMLVHTDAYKLRSVERMPDVQKIVPITNPDPNSAVAEAVEDPKRVKVG